MIRGLACCVVLHPPRAPSELLNPSNASKNHLYIALYWVILNYIALDCIELRYIFYYALHCIYCPALHCFILLGGTLLLIYVL